jgi:D-arabinose 1-dehydrogenase-like Zn-dependent alcohol dehydrogenase
MVRGTMSGIKIGPILGHEGVGVVEEAGEQVRIFHSGDLCESQASRRRPIKVGELSALRGFGRR